MICFDLVNKPMSSFIPRWWDERWRIAAADQRWFLLVLPTGAGLQIGIKPATDTGLAVYLAAADDHHRPAEDSATDRACHLGQLLCTRINKSLNPEAWHLVNKMPIKQILPFKYLGIVFI